MTGKKIYFASDFHLGVPDLESSLEREKAIVRWLDTIKQDAEEVYLVGDLFDFWFEYKYTIPKGYIRFLGKLAELRDAGIPITIFRGNHDMWMKDYLEKELDLKILTEPIVKVYSGKKFFIGHGDGLGPGDHKYKLLKWFFASKTCQWLFSRLHPNLAFYIAQLSSRKSRAKTGSSDEKFLGQENEWLYQFCLQHSEKEKIDYYIFGHRHLPLELNIEGRATYINLGEWIKSRTYAEFDGSNLKLRKYE